jgi:hypothetical protein
MEAIEKKLALAIDELIDEVIRMHPELTGALRSVQSVLREVSG